MNAGVNASEAVASGGFSQWLIIILVGINIGISYYQFKQTTKIREREIEDTNIRHKEMLEQQRQQFAEQLKQLNEQHTRELEVKVIVESQKERIEDIRELVNEYLSETASFKGKVNKIMQKKYRNNTFFNENFEEINTKYYESVETLQDKRTSLEFRLSELENTSNLLNLTKNLYFKTIRKPTHIKDLETYTYIEHYNDEHNEMKTEFINEASKFLKNEWKDLYNKIDKLSDF